MDIEPKALVVSCMVAWVGLSMAADPKGTVVKGCPEQVKEVNYLASVDNSEQPMLVYTAGDKEDGGGRERIWKIVAGAGGG